MNQCQLGVHQHATTINNYYNSVISLGKSEDFTMLEGETIKVVDLSADLDASKRYGVFLYEVHGTAPTETFKQVALGLSAGISDGGEYVTFSNPLLTIDPVTLTFTFEKLLESQKYTVSVVQIEV